jgi:hypothetical protein
MLHSCIFSCLDLTVLDLVACDFPGLPSGFAGFPNLTTLSLSEVGFPRGLGALEAMISSSSSLQRLRLEDLRMPDEDEQWVIHAPNLQSLLISSMFDYGLQIDDLPALEEAEINLRNYVDVQEIMNVISRLDQARILQLSMPVNCFSPFPLTLVSLQSTCIG